jgi:hypothetical protein
MYYDTYNAMENQQNIHYAQRFLLKYEIVTNQEASQGIYHFIVKYYNLLLPFSFMELLLQKLKNKTNFIIIFLCRNFGNTLG